MAIFLRTLLQIVLICIFIPAITYGIAWLCNPDYPGDYDNIQIFILGLISCFIAVIAVIIGNIISFFKHKKQPKIFNADVLDSNF